MKSSDPAWPFCFCRSDMINAGDRDDDRGYLSYLRRYAEDVPMLFSG